jgi:hypothetical protein
VWEGHDGWVILITRADESDRDDNFLVHKMITINSTLSVPTSGKPDTVAENPSMGGMAATGWKRIA